MDGLAGRGVEQPGASAPVAVAFLKRRFVCSFRADPAANLIDTWGVACAMRGGTADRMMVGAAFCSVAPDLLVIETPTVAVSWTR